MRIPGPPLKDSECRKDARKKERAKALAEWESFLHLDRDWPAASMVRMLFYKLTRTRRLLASPRASSVNANKYAKQIGKVEKLLEKALSLAPKFPPIKETPSEHLSRIAWWKRRLKDHFDWDWSYITEIMECKLIRASARIKELIPIDPELGGLDDILIEAAELLRNTMDDSYYLDWQSRKYGDKAFGTTHTPIKGKDGKVSLYELNFTYKGKPVPADISADEHRRFRWSDIRQQNDLGLALDLILEFAFVGWSKEAKKPLAKAFKMMHKNLRCWWD